MWPNGQVHCLVIVGATCTYSHIYTDLLLAFVIGTSIQVVDLELNSSAIIELLYSDYGTGQ